MPQNKKIDLFFYINLFCNDKCSFCFFSKLPPRDNFLRLADIRKVFNQLGENNIRGIILTGGEPTLNPDFWKIIDYIYNVYIKTNKVREFDLSTNAITSAKINIAKKIEKYFTSFDENYPDIKISFSFSSFKNPSRQKIIDKKIEGIKNLMKINGNIESVIVITKENYKDILEITKLLIQLHKKKKTKRYFFKVDYRLPYASMMYRIDDLKKLIIPFKDFSNVLNKVLDLIRKENIYTTLHNIPLCYIKNKPEYFIGRKPPQGIAIFPDKKTGFVKRKKMFEFDKNTECDGCKLKRQCSGIEKIYLENYNYLKLKPLIYEIIN